MVKKLRSMTFSNLGDIQLKVVNSNYQKNKK